VGGEIGYKEGMQRQFESEQGKIPGERVAWQAARDSILSHDFIFGIETRQFGL